MLKLSLNKETLIHLDINDSDVIGAVGSIRSRYINCTSWTDCSGSTQVPTTEITLGPYTGCN